MCFTLAIVGGQKKWQQEVWQRSCEGDAVLVRTRTPLSLLLCNYACFIILFGFISVSLSQSRHEAYSCKLEHGDMSCVSTLFFFNCVLVVCWRRLAVVVRFSPDTFHFNAVCADTTIIECLRPSRRWFPVRVKHAEP